MQFSVPFDGDSCITIGANTNITLKEINAANNREYTGGLSVPRKPGK